MYDTVDVIIILSVFVGFVIALLFADRSGYSINKSKKETMRDTALITDDASTISFDLTKGVLTMSIGQDGVRQSVSLTVVEAKIITDVLTRYVESRKK